MDHYDCIKPLLRVQQCLGIGAFYAKKQNNFKPHEYYTKKFDFLVTLFIVVLTASLFIIHKYQSPYEPLDNNCFLQTLYNTQYVFGEYLGMFVFFIQYIMIYKHRFIIMEAHTMIDEVDKTLRDFQCDVPYRKIRNFSLIAALLLIFLEILDVMLGYYIIFIDIDLLLEFFKSFICDLTQCVVDSIVIGIFINFMVCLRYRFRVINELLVRNSKQSVTTNIRSLESERILNEQEIDALTKTHEKLCDVSDSISDAFSLVLFCDMAYLFVLVIIDVYLAIKLFILLFTTDMNANVDEDRISFWFAVAQQLTCVVAIFSIKLILLVLSAELVIGEASKTHAFVHKSINCYDEDSIRNKLTIFLTQLINRKPTFTPCGLFELNLPLLLSMVGTLFTYIIILIQFVESDAGCKQFLTEITDNSTNSSLEIVANDTSTNMKNNLMKLIESGKHLPSLGTNLSFPIFETNLSFANDSIQSNDLLSDLSSKMMNIIQNMSNMNDLLKNISSNIQNLLLNN